MILIIYAWLFALANSLAIAAIDFVGSHARDDNDEWHEPQHATMVCVVGQSADLFDGRFEIVSREVW